MLLYSCQTNKTENRPLSRLVRDNYGVVGTHPIGEQAKRSRRSQRSSFGGVRKHSFLSHFGPDLLMNEITALRNVFVKQDGEKILT